MKSLFSSDSPFFVGANYWCSNAGTFMWRSWSPEAVERDFRILHENGAQVLRVFPLWSDFQKLTDHLHWAGEHEEFRYGEEPLADSGPEAAAVDPEMLDRFRHFCRLAEKYELKLIVGLITGWMSGRLFAPPALEHRNLLNDPVAIMWEVRYVRTLVRELKDESAIAAWDWGNECNCLAPHTPEEMWCWGNTISCAIREEDRTRCVISGLHGADKDVMHDMGEVAEILCTHPYPAFTPHCDCDCLDQFRSLFHAAAQTCYWADHGNRPAFAEEVGSFGPTFNSDRVSAEYVRNALWNTYAHSCHGFLWWCANDQTELLQTPYDWNSMERELGLIKVDGTPKQTLTEMGNFGRFAAQHVLPPHRTDAVVIASHDTDQWGLSFVSFLLAKQAGFDVSFADGMRKVPESKCYILPSISGTRIIPRHICYELLDRVKAGATLYLSSAYCALQPFDGFGVEIESVSRAPQSGTVILPDSGEMLTVQRKYRFRLGKIKAKILAGDQEGNPVFTAASYGKGKLIFLAMPLEESLIDRSEAFEDDAPDYAEIYRMIAREAGIRRLMSVSDAQVTLTEHPAPEGNVFVTAVNNRSELVEVPFTLAPGYQIAETAGAGTLRNALLTIPAHDGMLLMLRKTDL